MKTVSEMGHFPKAIKRLKNDAEHELLKLIEPES